MLTSDAELCSHALTLCQRLIRIDTTNPPGNERPAAELLAEELCQAGLEPVVLESAPRRANLVVRLRGTGEAPPLLLTAHLDVVAAEPSAWQIPPFSYLVPGFTDAKAFSRLGIRWYGFCPVRLPRALRFADLFHGHNERIPLDGLRWGTQVLAEVVGRCAKPI